MIRRAAAASILRAAAACGRWSRSAAARFRRYWRCAAAAAGGAMAAAAGAGLVAPLALAGGVRVQQAAALFREELAQYRAADADLRASLLVSAAAAGYEDRGLFHRPSWLPPLSPAGLLRAVVRNLRGIPEGGSTIPQQLAKLYLREGRRAAIADKLSEADWRTCCRKSPTPCGKCLGP